MFNLKYKQKYFKYKLKYLKLKNLDYKNITNPKNNNSFHLNKQTENILVIRPTETILEIENEVNRLNEEDKKKLLKIKHNGKKLKKFIGLQNNKACVFYAVKNNGSAIEYADNDLKKNIRIICESIINNGYSIEFINLNEINIDNDNLKNELIQKLIFCAINKSNILYNNIPLKEKLLRLLNKIKFKKNGDDILYEIENEIKDIKTQKLNDIYKYNIYYNKKNDTYEIKNLSPS